MLDDWAFNQVLGVQRFLVWSKDNALHRIFYRTTVAGHWSKDDIDEFNKLGCIYEIHLDHSHDEIAQQFALKILERCDTFKAAKLVKLAVNDMKVLTLLGRDSKMKDKIIHLCRQCDFDFGRIRYANEPMSKQESETMERARQYLGSLAMAYKPLMGG